MRTDYAIVQAVAFPRNDEFPLNGFELLTPKGIPLDTEFIAIGDWPGTPEGNCWDQEVKNSSVDSILTSEDLNELAQKLEESGGQWVEESGATCLFIFRAEYVYSPHTGEHDAEFGIERFVTMRDLMQLE